MAERIAVVGIGRLGLCLSLNLDRAGYDVLGVDKDRELVRRICNRELRTREPGVEEALRTTREFRAADDIGAVGDFAPALIFVAVDTPTAGVGGYDASRVDRVMRDLCSPGAVRDPTDLVLVSTVLPGYCDSNMARASAHGYALSYSPGFVAQGSIMRDQQHPSMVLIGEADTSAGERIERVYGRMCRNEPPVHRMSPLSAEIAKLATNSFVTMKIAFANAIGDLATRAGAEPERILGAIGADRRIGPGCLQYGFGYGGPCFPRDNRALNFFAKQHDCELLQAEATDVMNSRHRAFQLGEYLRAGDPGCPIHFHSVTYKPGTDMLDESQPLALALELARAGRTVVIHDTPEVIAELRDTYGDLFEYRAGGRP